MHIGGYTSLDQAIRGCFGADAAIVRRRRLTGGDINDAWHLELTGGGTAFLKTNALRNAAFFRTEARGLEALRAAGAIGVPQVLAVGTDAAQGVAFLLLEYLEEGEPVRDYWARFGTQLARLHRADCSALWAGRTDGPYGFPEDNFIGASPQRNAWRARWAAFYRDCRLAPQLEMAWRALDAPSRRAADRLLGRLEEELREPPFPSLLHGDLWSGNVRCGPDGRAWILDPAAYIGDCEADLAMTELFGRFHRPFYEAYRAENPLDAGYPHRRELYQLYHLLNHLNLFGAGYLGSVTRILRRWR